MGPHRAGPAQAGSQPQGSQPSIEQVRAVVCCSKPCVSVLVAPRMQAWLVYGGVRALLSRLTNAGL